MRVCAREYKCLRDCDNAQFVFHTSLRTYTGEQFSPYPTDGPFKLKWTSITLIGGGENKAGALCSQQEKQEDYHCYRQGHYHWTRSPRFSSTAKKKKKTQRPSWVCFSAKFISEPSGWFNGNAGVRRQRIALISVTEHATTHWFVIDLASSLVWMFPGCVCSPIS